MRFAILGSPIGHSKSPKMHAAAYRALGLPHTFEAFDVPEEKLAVWVEKLRDGTFEGMSITIPHKKRVLVFADEVTEEARRIGAANTLSRSEHGRVVAHNTDAPALVHEFSRLRAGEALVHDRGLVLGSGGASLAAIEALATAGARTIEVRARAFADSATAEAFLTDLRSRWGADRAGVELLATAWMAGGEREKSVEWVVQATSLGMRGGGDGELAVQAISWPLLPKSAVVVDAVYGSVTPFLARARAEGLRADDGAGMLLEQGAIAFRGWLGLDPPRDVMRAALL